MKTVGDCSECCHVRVCTHEQLLYKDGVFKIYQAECRATNGLHFCYKNEPPLSTVDPVDWYLWEQLKPAAKDPNAIDLTQTVIVPRPVWEVTEDEPVKTQSVKTQTTKTSGHTTGLKNSAQPGLKNSAQPGIKNSAPPGLKKVCKSTTESSEDWWNKMKNKPLKD